MAIRAAGICLILLPLAGCVGVTADRGAISSPPAASPDVRMLTDAMLPAVYEGDLPCADCPGIRVALDIRADRVYFLRQTYLGRGAGASFDDIGVWSITPNAQTVILRGGREAPMQFSIENSETLRKLDTEGKPIESTLNYELRRNASYRPLEPRVLMRGMYSYMADAGIFRECITQLKLPVAQLADNAALESAYQRARQQPNEEVLVSVDGRVTLRPRTEGDAQQQSLIVERFVSARPGESCDAPVSVALENTHWTLVHAIGEPVVTPADRSEAYMTLDPIGTKVVGFGGCNRFSGVYQLDGNKLHFKDVAMTMMACMDSHNPETRFVQIFNDAAHWQVTGQQLVLSNAAGKPIATFNARAKP